LLLEPMVENLVMGARFSAGVEHFIKRQFHTYKLMPLDWPRLEGWGSLVLQCTLLVQEIRR
jgi:hypothetical protein